MKRLVAFLLAAALMLSLAACGEKSVSAPPLADSISVVYDTAKVERGDVVGTIAYDAYVMPFLGEASLEEASGVVDELLVHIGDSVSVGDPLLKLNTEVAEQRLEAARASLEELTDTGALNRRLVSIDLELARIALDEAKEGGDATAISLAELEVERKRTALSDYDARYSRQTEAARTQISELEKSIAACTLRSPIDGRVAVLPAEGSYASGASPIACIASDEGRYIRYDGITSIPGGRYTYMVVDGEKVELKRYEYTDRENAQFDARGETPPPRFVRADGKDLPAVGEYVQLLVERERSNDTLRLPTGAVRRDSGISYVYIVENGEKIYKEVRTGASSGAYVEILEGLSEGDEVYVGN